VCLAVDLFASDKENLPLNSLPSEQTVKDIQNLSGVNKLSHNNLRAGGPPGSGTGGGGAVGTVIAGRISYEIFFSIVALYFLAKYKRTIY